MGYFEKYTVIIFEISSHRFSIGCRSLGDLNECFQYLFEQLEEVQTSSKIMKDNSSATAQIVNDIMRGALSIGSLTVPQSLEFLIDLGLEKLKNDYIVILKKFSKEAEDVVLNMWR